MVEDKARRTYSFAILNTLEFLRRSGRVSRLAAGLGSLLDIKPMIKMHLGEMALEKIRTRNGALLRLIGLVNDLGPLEQIALVHTHALEKARDLQKIASHLFPQTTEIWAEEVTPVIGAHVGPGAVGIVCIASE
jgi:DegV family protein with EDD domain